MKNIEGTKSMFYRKPELHGRLDNYGKLTKKGKQVVLYEVYDGFGLPLDVLRAIKSVEIHYKGEAYLATVADFKEHGVEHTFENPRTHRQEEQLILPRKYWRSAKQGTLL